MRMIGLHIGNETARRVGFIPRFEAPYYVLKEIMI